MSVSTLVDSVHANAHPTGERRLSLQRLSYIWGRVGATTRAFRMARRPSQRRVVNVRVFLTLPVAELEHKPSTTSVPKINRRNWSSRHSQRPRLADQATRTMEEVSSRSSNTLLSYRYAVLNHCRFRTLHGLSSLHHPARRHPSRTRANQVRRRLLSGSRRYRLRVRPESNQKDRRSGDLDTAARNDDGLGDRRGLYGFGLGIFGFLVDAVCGLTQYSERGQYPH